MLLTEPMSEENVPAIFQKDEGRMSGLLNLFLGNSGQVSILRKEGGKVDLMNENNRIKHWDNKLACGVDTSRGL